MDNVTLLNGDCLELMKNIPDGSVDCVITDIPYNEVNRKSNGLRNLNKEKADIGNFDLKNLSYTLCNKTNGSIYIFCGINQISAIRESFQENSLSTRLIIWEKNNPSPMNGDKIWLSGIECCVFGKKSNATFNYHCKNSVLKFPTQSGKLHPTMKPIKLMEYIVNASTNESNIVLDPFMGSGSTGVAAVNTNRRFIGIEKDDNYFEIAKKRIEEAIKQKQQNLFINGTE